MIINTRIYDPMMIGRLESGHSNFINGHIYYENNVIKVRYDLLDKINSGELGVDKLFDPYYNILSLGDGFKIKGLSPRKSCEMHKIAYVIEDIYKESCQTCCILPYLHDRKLVLKNCRTVHSYAYTSFESETIYPEPGWKKAYNSFIAVHEITNSCFYIYRQNGVLVNKINYRNY